MMTDAYAGVLKDSVRKKYLPDILELAWKRSHTEIRPQMPCGTGDCGTDNVFQS
ncbi:MAG: hypothetical protein GY749_01080 [Desulfobacteraceae bacterium]|nr:hypothetical protein [Desulfobacteraceae bacterium]